MSRRVLLVISSWVATVVLVLGFGCATGSDLTQVDADIINAVLQTIHADGQCLTCLVAAETEAFSPWTGSPASDGRFPIPPEFAENYRARNETRVRIDASKLPKEFSPIDGETIRDLFGDGPRVGWERVAETFGRRTAIVRVSMPAYDNEREHALVTYSYDFGFMGGETSYVLLSREGGVWRIKKKVTLVMT